MPVELSLSYLRSPLVRIWAQSRPVPVAARPPGQIRGQKTERTKILYTNPGQVFPGLIPGEGSRKESGTDQNSIPKPPPGYQVRPNLKHIGDLTRLARLC
ncbi:hypothetical protein ACLKA6_016908 [Drosophila palustris]